ncbi:MAG: hypothetical protein ACK2UJ_11600 [Candidatus Promineifilaceae bacterium]
MNWQAELRQAIMEHFSEADIKALCFDMGLDYEELSGDSKTEKVIGLIDYFDRMDEIPKLIAYCSRYRPNVPWDEIEQAAETDGSIPEKSPPRIGAYRKPRQLSGSMIAAAAFIFLALTIIIAALIVVPRLNQPGRVEVAAERPAVNQSAAEANENTVAANSQPENPQGSGAAAATDTAVPTDEATPTSEPTPTATPAPTDTPTATAAPTDTPEFCPGAPPTRLSIGDRARTTSTVFIKSDPGSSNSTRFTVGAGRFMEITGGPECSDGTLWYEIEGVPFTSSTGARIAAIGWVAESSEGEYVLETLN